MTETLFAELERLQATDPEALETTLLIHPLVLNDFDDYNQFLDVADAAVAAAAALFVAGFSTVFVTLGATASVIGQVIRQYSDILALAAGLHKTLKEERFDKVVIDKKVESRDRYYKDLEKVIKDCELLEKDLAKKWEKVLECKDDAERAQVRDKYKKAEVPVMVNFLLACWAMPSTLLAVKVPVAVTSPS